MKYHHTSRLGAVLLHALLTYTNVKINVCNHAPCLPDTLSKTAFTLIANICIHRLQRDGVSLVLFCSSGTRLVLQCSLSHFSHSYDLN